MRLSNIENTKILNDKYEFQKAHSLSTSTMKKIKVSLFDLMQVRVSVAKDLRTSILSFSQQNYEVNKCNLINLTLLASCGTFFMGYNEAVFDTMEERMHETFEPIWKDSLSVMLTLINIGLTLGAVFGSLCCGWMTNSLGRKNTLLLLDFIAIIGTALTLFEDLIMIIIGRIIIGFCLGGFTTVSRLYMVEISPIQLKPRCMAAIEVLEMFAILLAYVLGLGFTNVKLGNSDYWWRIMFGLNFVNCGLHMIFTLIFYNFDTPLFTYIKDLEEDVTKQVLKEIYKNDFETNAVYREIVRITEEIKEKRNLSFLDLFKNSKYRKKTLICIAIVIGSVFVGSDALIFYSNLIFLSYTSSENSTIYTNIIGFSQLVGSIIAVSFVEHINRKKLFLYGYLGMILLLIISGILFYFDIYNLVIAAMIAIITYNVMTVGPLTHLYISEVLPEKGLALAYSILYLAKLIMILTFKPIENSSISFEGLFFIYSCLTVVNLIVIYFNLEETHGKTLQQIEELYT